MDTKTTAGAVKLDGLEAIRAEGAELVAGADRGQAAGPSQAELAAKQLAADDREAMEWAGIPFIFGRILASALPELTEHYTEEKCRQWGEAMLPVARRYGWTAGVAGLWCTLGGVTWGMAKPTYDAVKKRKAERAAAKPATGEKPTGNVTTAT